MTGTVPGNVRGNTYSTNHTTLKPRQAAFWDWSFDEMAAYDLPAMLNYVIEATGAETLSYFGHSQVNFPQNISTKLPHVAPEVHVTCLLC